jgi:hypothetical protein
MNKTTPFAALITGLLLAGSSTAMAQTQDANSFFVEFNVAAQTQARSLTASTSIPLYGETAVMNAVQAIDSGGLWEIGGGYRVTPSLAIGIGFSTFSKSGDGILVASIPSPTVFNRPLTVTTTTTGLQHREVGTHLMAVWFVPVAENIDVTVFAGPSFFRLRQDVMTATIPAGTQATTVTSQSESGNATGANIGASVNYMFAPRYGAGIFLRYAGASVGLPPAGELNVGGFQIGGGFRLRL